MSARQVSIDEESLKDLLTLVQGPGYVSESARQQAIHDGLAAIRRGPPAECEGQLTIPGLEHV